MAYYGAMIDSCYPGAGDSVACGDVGRAQPTGGVSVGRVVENEDNLWWSETPAGGEEVLRFAWPRPPPKGRRIRVPNVSAG